MQADAIYIGLDIGTSGARAIAMHADGVVLAEGKSAMLDHGENHRDPEIWWSAASVALKKALQHMDASRVVAICVDGTSGTMIPVDEGNKPLSLGRMYNDPCDDQTILDRITQYAPLASAAHGSTSGLAKALVFQDTANICKVVHQADWIAGCLCGTFSSDANNALKTGFDPVSEEWPTWMSATGLNMDLLPDVHAPGMPIECLLPEIAGEFGLPSNVRVVAGTTDGCASFLATGAEMPGDGVSALGTTLTIKILSDQPIFDPACGIYSHFILGNWLAGGASNTGGNVLLAHFSPEEMAELSAGIDPNTPSKLDYYPLVRPGERFPISDPLLPPRMSPIPEDRQEFLKELYEGIAGVEAMGYSKLAELGAPDLKSVRSVGGGAQDKAFSAIRKKRLGVELLKPESSEAAYGAARLARFGMNS